MKTICKLFYLGIALSVVVSSCTIEKRVYNSGYHVTWKNGKTISEQNEFEASNRVVSPEEESIETITSIENPSQKSVIETTKTQTSTLNAKEVNTNNPLNEKEVVSSKSQGNTMSSSKKKTGNIKSSAERLNKTHDQSKNQNDDTVMLVLLLILCFLIPPLAVGIKTDWEMRKLLISLILTFFFWLPGIIYALLIVLDVI